MSSPIAGGADSQPVSLPEPRQELPLLAMRKLRHTLPDRGNANPGFGSLARPMPMEHAILGGRGLPRGE